MSMCSMDYGWRNTRWHLLATPCKAPYTDHLNGIRIAAARLAKFPMGQDLKDTTIRRFLLPFAGFLEPIHHPFLEDVDYFFHIQPNPLTALCSCFDWHHCSQDGAANSFCLVISLFFFSSHSANLTSKSGGWVSRARITELQIGAVMLDLWTTWCGESFTSGQTSADKWIKQAPDEKVRRAASPFH